MKKQIRKYSELDKNEIRHFKKLEMQRKKYNTKYLYLEKKENYQVSNLIVCQSVKKLAKSEKIIPKEIEGKMINVKKKISENKTKKQNKGK